MGGYLIVFCLPVRCLLGLCLTVPMLTAPAFYAEAQTSEVVMNSLNLPYERAADGKRVTVTQAASMLGCSRSWVYRLIEDRRLKAYRIGSRKGMQVTLRSLRAYLASRELPQVKAIEQ